MVIALLVVFGVLASRWGLGESLPPPAEAIVVAGGGGNPQGVGKGPAAGILPSGKDVVEPDKEPPKVVGPNEKPPDLQEIKPRPDAILPKDASAQDARAIDKDTAAALGQLSNIGKQANDKIAGILAGKGRGGSGEGGGKGRGKGTGEGDLEGPGKAQMTQREKRQIRWRLVFNTYNGDDYLKQLADLGAILAIPQPRGGYIVIPNQDLLKRPVQLKEGDVAALDRIWWTDDKPQTVQDVARILGLPFIPECIHAFFPAKLEKELLDKELRYPGNKGIEDNIEATVFRVARKEGRYEPVVVDQKLKRR
jgi:hypothetical protein